MPRKGMEKVRTGCRTCKIRKVKCDEGRPHCVRCRSTGRKCDGYMEPPLGWFPWSQLIHMQPSTFPNAGELELRSLAFFRQVVAPVLSGPLDASFWTRLVAQMVQKEPAARHAVVAISALYERFDQQSGDSQGFALRHYNNAIRHVLSLSVRSVETVLLVSILFICIEFLRGNVEGAINHLRHGMNVLLSSPPHHANFFAIYRHLAIFPPFFSGGVLPDLPVPNHRLEDDIHDLFEAQAAMDWLALKTIRLVRAADHYRLGVIQSLESTSLALEQKDLINDLEKFRLSMEKLKNEKTNNEDFSLLLEIRWLVCSIWSSSCLAKEETVYDAHTHQFEKIINLAERVQEHQGVALAQRSKFMFQMGFAPLLHFVVLKCRHLPLRLAALALTESLSCQREVLWDVKVLNSIGKRIIEVEHGLDLPTDPTLASGIFSHHLLPADEQRIRDSVLTEETELSADTNGMETMRRKIHFFVADRNGQISCIHDWITLK